MGVERRVQREEGNPFIAPGEQVASSAQVLVGIIKVTCGSPGLLSELGSDTIS